jgi:hypothetical protein
MLTGKITFYSSIDITLKMVILIIRFYNHPILEKIHHMNIDNLSPAYFLNLDYKKQKV